MAVPERLLYFELSHCSFNLDLSYWLLHACIAGGCSSEVVVNGGSTVDEKRASYSLLILQIENMTRSLYIDTSCTGSTWEKCLRAGILGT